jgi:hypothetical protein
MMHRFVMQTLQNPPYVAATTQHPRVHYIHCDILTPDKTPKDITSTQTHGGWCNISVSKPPPFLPECDKTSTLRQFPCLFHYVPLPILWHISQFDILPLFDTCFPSHAVTFSPTVSFSPSGGHISPSPFIVYLHSVLHVCVQNMYVQSSKWGGRG